MKDYSETIPVQYQEGKAFFMGMEVMVDHRTLIPRPETELLVSVACDLCRKKSWEKPFVMDIGTGSGVIPVGLVKRMSSCRVIGSDISEDALKVALANLERFDGKNRVKLVLSDMFSAFARRHEGVFDCIVSNPPYVAEGDYEKLDAWVKAEPRIALFAGKRGMDYLEVIAGESCFFLKPGGFIAVEVGYDQAEKVKRRFSESGFTNIRAFRDFNGYERIVTGWKHG